MKRLAVVLLASAFLTGCTSGTMVQAEGNVFERHRVDSDHVILVDTETKVCYLQYGETVNFTTGASYSGITVMLNADGTPKLWEE